jgi:hypothetical protein
MLVSHRKVLKNYGSKVIYLCTGQEAILDWKGVLKSSQNTQNSYNEINGENYSLWL